MVLHVLNGDATRVPLEQSGMAGKTAVWADVLHDGPVPDLPRDKFLEVRARHHATCSGESYEETVAWLEGWYNALESYRDYEEVVFWFEHDLFDQAILIHHLNWLSGIQPGDTRFSLICIGAYPGHPNFAGLGELSPPELATLFPLRQPITAAQIDLGRRVWKLFCAADPVPLSDWAALSDTSSLPFLAGAMRRHLEDFPSAASGVARSERQILQAIDEGAGSPVEVFLATQKMEERIFMGDLTFWQIIRRLAAGRHPLLVIEGSDASEKWVHDGRLKLTQAGRDALAEKADYIALNGIDRWIGGAHLTTDRHWRWDGTGLTLVNS